MIENSAENSSELFKEYLCEVIKRFLDKETIVQEAACTSFIDMVTCNKEKIEPYLSDILRVITNCLDKFKDTSLITLYDIIILITENYGEHFNNIPVCGSLIENIINKWYEMLNARDLKNITPIIDIICALIRCCRELLKNQVKAFIEGSITLIEENIGNYLDYKNNDKSYSESSKTLNFSMIDREVVSKCMDLISTVCQALPDQVSCLENKHKILDVSIRLIEINDTYIIHYAIATFGDLTYIQTDCIVNNYQKIFKILLSYMDLPTKIDKLEIEKISIVSNSCWTIGLYAIKYPELVMDYTMQFLEKLLKILSHNKLNKSLAQNVAICIGRLSYINSECLSKYLDLYLKPFCLSLRNVKDSLEKREAFT